MQFEVRLIYNKRLVDYMVIIWVCVNFLCSHKLISQVPRSLQLFISVCFAHSRYNCKLSWIFDEESFVLVSLELELMYHVCIELLKLHLLMCVELVNLIFIYFVKSLVLPLSIIWIVQLCNTRTYTLLNIRFVIIKTIVDKQEIKSQHIARFSCLDIGRFLYLRSTELVWVSITIVNTTMSNSMHM